MVSLIAALGHNRVIGLDGRVPWAGRLPGDVAHYHRFITGKPVLMGSGTYDPSSKSSSLPSHIYVLTSRDVALGPNASIVRNLNDVPFKPDLVVAGGAQVYEQTLPLADEMVLTLVDYDGPGDRYFPAWDEASWREIKRENFPADKQNHFDYSIVTFRKM